MVSVYNGQFSIENSTFINNYYKFLPAPVFLDDKSMLRSNIDNCGDKNGGDKDSPKPTCNGVFVQQAAGDCFNKEKCVGDCQVFTSQVCIIVDCYSDWEQLSLALKEASLQGQGGIYELCPDTVFKVDEYPNPDISPIVINTTDTMIRCGNSSSRENSCVIRGGSQHFVVEGMPKKVVFVGVTFLTSSLTSISANGDSTADLAFIDCEWAGHTGASVITIYNGGIEDINKINLADVLAPKKTSMTVSLVNCTFSGNSVSHSSISNFNGTLFADKTLFLNNVAPGGAIVTLFSGQLALSNTCFIGTRSEDLPGIAFLQQGSVLLTNENNYGSGNNSSSVSKCSDIFIETKGSCFNQGNCEGDCVELKAQLCDATDFELTPTPSITPSLLIFSDFPSMTLSLESGSPSVTSSKVCFAEWDALSTAVRSASLSGDGETFILCPNTVMKVDSFPEETITPIIVDSNGIVIQCGV